ncbi:MAG: 7TM diverse intracellular signaling domain-containing protein, partial [Anaerolineales bacterium]|nr:7TM diverse intracellular signaling domain-containing protein [Anaerolineales bacterium]
MKYKSLPLALFFLAAIALTARAQTAENLQSPPVALTEDRGRYPLGLHLDILEDAEGELTIEDVAAEPFAGLFASSQVDVPNFGFTESVYWVRFRLDNQSRQVDEWLLEQGFANTHYIDFYTPLPDGTGFAVAPSGVLRPPENRSIRHQHIIFNLHLPPQSQETFYLRFQSGASMTMDLKLWEKDTFLAASQVNQVWNGIFYGLLIGLFAYNLFLLVSFREATYLYFEILLGASILFFLSYDGFAEIYLFPDHYFLVRYSMPLFMTTMFSSMVLFADAFLELKQYYQKIHRVNLGILAVWLALLLITPLSSYYFQAMFMAPWGMVSAAAILIAAIVSLRRDSRPTRFFVVAWSGLLITYILALMVREGLVPSTPITENTLRVGLAWMAVSSSIALADRINLLKAETDSARHRLAQILDGLPLGVIVFKKDLKPSFSNRRVGEIVATPWQDLRDDPAGAPSLAQSLQDYSARMAGSSEEYPLDNLPILSALRGEMAYIDDIEISRGDERIVLEIQASPVRDDAGNIETAVVAIQDITYRKGIEAELEEHRLHLERLVEERTRDLNAANNELHAEATERTKLEKSLSQRVEWLSLINNILPTINGAADLYQAYERITADIYEILRARMVFLFRWNEEAGQAAIFHDPGQEAASPDLADLQSAFQISSPLRNWLEKGKPVLLNADPAGSFPRPFEVFSREDASGPLALARLVARGDSIGVLGVLLPASSETSRQQEVALINKMASDLARL